MRNLTARETLLAFLMLITLSILQYAIGIDGVVSFLVGALAVAIASFFGFSKRSYEEAKNGYWLWVDKSEEERDDGLPR